MELNKSAGKMKEQGLRLLNNQIKASVLLISSLLLVPLCVKCQTWDEIFKQQETQKKYLVEQIVALKIYAGYLKKGYDIAGTGLQTVKELSNGEFKLHRSFISSLKTVNPGIRNDLRIVEIIGFQLNIKNAFKSIIKREALSDSEMDYIETVRNEIMKKCTADLGELLLILTSGRIELTEQERINRLKGVYESMRDKFAFTQSYVNQVNLLLRQKTNEQKSLNQIQQLYENE